ncbi:hypothetical protein [Cognatiyoonia sp. IB215182]|uniref:hypothetical protein n=1 Tax=Cognatiyoonia sp. IB215182 TaxID=3097353 RepID=UPI002A1853C5|nr:hypothetical protein [Cognatiyoonia sp. IB215182]MDX8352933.1 hypothetical protein [Cognatiyoonia sp. IB215182]
MGRTILIVAALVAAGGAGWYFTRPTELTLRAELTAGGLDVTDKVHWSVLEVLAEDAVDGFAMSDVERVSPQPDRPNVFAVSGGRLHTVEAVVLGLQPYEKRITPTTRSQTTETFTLNAGLLEVTVIGGDMNDMRFYVDYDSGGIGGGIAPDEPTYVAVPAGAYRVGVTDEVTDVSANVDLAEGVIEEITLDFRQGELTVALPNWDATLPGGRATLSTPDGDYLDEVLLTADGRAVFDRLVYGDYVVSLNADGVMEPPLPANVTLDAEAKTENFDWDYARVNVDFSAIDMTDARWPEVQVVEASDRGFPYTTHGIEGGTSAVLPFAPLPNDPADLEFAVSLRMDNKVVAMQSIGRPAAGQAIDVTLIPDTGYTLCTKLFFPSDCAMAPE